MATQNEIRQLKLIIKRDVILDVIEFLPKNKINIEFAWNSPLK